MNNVTTTTYTVDAIGELDAISGSQTSNFTYDSWERITHLVYVDLVDFTLRQRVDAFMDDLYGPHAIGWHVFSWYGGKAVTRRRALLRQLGQGAHEAPSPPPQRPCAPPS